MMLPDTQVLPGFYRGSLKNARRGSSGSLGKKVNPGKPGFYRASAR